MDQEIKSAWVEALRSGKYRQGQGRLVKNYWTDENGDRHEGEAYCCLGVLCDIHPEITWDGNFAVLEGAIWEDENEPNESDDNYWDYTPPITLVDGSEDSAYGGYTQLPDSLRERVGITPSQESALISMNDSEGKSFDKIANYIEENL